MIYNEEWTPENGMLTAAQKLSVLIILNNIRWILSRCIKI
jgi:hypothetical protein